METASAAASPTRVLTCVAVDDEPLATAVMQRYCAQLPFLQLVATFHDAMSALAYLQTHPVDVVFLDIEMPGLTGIQLAQILPPGRTRVVLTTAYDQYAVQGYELGVADYLVKPIGFQRFVQAANRLYHSFVPADTPAAPAEPASAPVAHAETPPAAADAMFVKNEHRLQRVAFDDILYIEGMKDYLMIYTAESGKILTLQSFRRVEEVLPPQRFARIHKSFLVALNRIEHVERGKVQIAGRLLPVGDAYRDGFMGLIRAYNQL
ncbi:LytTR family DNA-binding domain-containing protein [Hymenobacter sp. 15J16-1T3B]|uniref:LytR/AlgR family response regulator transcription factor n=1 Tax=Hymenobacter sp. 15J16-1T3B TaxID=2886941 RepID=UPI001D0F9AE3|nr:LytTR family DNA-binding domain-containing protein [Hymenobacter sp. 15J16-1T3B]MCC3157926.1 LytTR family DNA-binding domain-containing protein [Hymenobacter sp. 15J16-1T3B]